MTDNRRRSLAQSTVEFALTLPVLLLFLLIAIDFGRIYLGYINIQNLARIAANFAANNADAWATPTDPAVLASYQSTVSDDMSSQSCTIPAPGTIPAPQFVDQNGNGRNDDLGDLATVAITCQFQILTPGISSIFGNNGFIDVSASASFPVKDGGIAGVPGGGGGGSNLPVADFSGSPLTATLPASGGVDVTFTDLSTNVPTGWLWTFGDGNSANTQNPTHTYLTAGDFTVSLQASNSAGATTKTVSGYIHIDPAPAGLDANFSGTPTSGAGTPNLTVQFTDTSTGGTVTSWQWDFDNNGTVDSTVPNPSFAFAPGGSPYSVKLTVGDGTTTNVELKIAYITVGVPQCVVPNVSDGRTSVNTALATINGSNLVGVKDPNNPNGNWQVGSQNPQGGLLVNCGSSVTVFK